MKEEKLKFIFKFFDENNEDYITPKLIINVLKSNKIPVNQDEVLEIFDGDDSKMMSFDEFKKLMI